MVEHPVTDESLMLAVGQGDQNAFAQLVERHQSWAWKIAYRFMGNSDGTADIVQDAFLRLLTSACRYQPNARFKTYFYRIITNLCLDSVRKKKPIQLDPSVALKDHRPDAADLFERQETQTAITTALNCLPPKQRIAIVLRYYEGLNYQEIASILSTSPKAVERLLGRGRDQLKKILNIKNTFFQK